ncbi:MAG: hypothetical protein H7X80_00455, partial [bacterium]|nr:hypothetical protein [Candidatus Kapabacteria bacterium]
MNNYTSETLVIVAALVLIGFIVWLLFRRYQSGSQVRVLRIETFSRLLDRFPAT